MNATEFLAVIEEYPLPWKISSAQPYYTDEPGGGWAVPLAAQLYHDGDLQLAAPAMAATIIRLYLAPQADYRDAMEALRTSLPESLRP